MNSETPWVVFDSRTGLGTCRRCGEVLNMPLPQPIYVFSAATMAFCKMHEECRETASRVETDDVVGEGAK